MHAHPRQRDIIRESDAGNAAACRAAAETALKDPHFTPREQRERHDYYMQRAAECERMLQGATR